MTNKTVFNVKNIDLGKLALSYGLVSSPEMVIKTKNEVENEINEENIKNIELRNKKIEEEKNLIKDNLIPNDNKKKSKLFKLKEKIKLKKLMKQQKENKQNEELKDYEKIENDDDKSFEDIEKEFLEMSKKKKRKTTNL